MRIDRIFAWPNKATFTMPPVRKFLRQWLVGGNVIIDPFAANETFGTLTNDIDPETTAMYHMEARDFLNMLVEKKVKADRIIFDPPHGPVQISRAYKKAGKKATREDTQLSKLKHDCRNLFRKLATPDCIIISFGWNTAHMGKGWDTEEILLVNHGGDHNDTICTAQRATQNAKLEVLADTPTVQYMTKDEIDALVKANTQEGWFE
jgi:hypothetical protein